MSAFKSFKEVKKNLLIKKIKELRKQENKRHKVFLFKSKINLSIFLYFFSIVLTNNKKTIAQECLTILQKQKFFGRYYLTILINKLYLLISTLSIKQTRNTFFADELKVVLKDKDINNFYKTEIIKNLKLIAKGEERILLNEMATINELLQIEDDTNREVKQEKIDKINNAISKERVKRTLINIAEHVLENKSKIDTNKLQEEDYLNPFYESIKKHIDQL